MQRLMDWRERKIVELVKFVSLKLNGRCKLLIWTVGVRVGVDKHKEEVEIYC